MRLSGLIGCLLLLVSTPVFATPTDPLAPGEHRVELRGIEIWYEVRGSGPAVVFQPGGAGWGGDATVYIETLSPLEATHTVIYFDPVGIGRSGRADDPERYTMSEYVEDLEAFRKHLGIEALSLAGHSHGGSVAMMYALAYPDRVDRLLLLNTGPYVRDLDPDWLATREGFPDASARLSAMDTTLSANDQQAEFIRALVPALHFRNYEPVRHLVEDILARTRFSAEPFRQFEREYAAFDLSDRVVEIQAPTLVVVGDDDPPDLREGSHLLHERMPDARLFVVSDCGHWPWLERPELFYPAVLDFLAARR